MPAILLATMPMYGIIIWLFATIRAMRSRCQGLAGGCRPLPGLLAADSHRIDHVRPLVLVHPWPGLVFTFENGNRLFLVDIHCLPG